VVYEKYKDSIPELADLFTPGAGGKPASSAYPYIERAPTGRSKCMTCNKTIAKDEERLAIERTFESFGATHTGPGFMHLACAQPEQVTVARAKQKDAGKPVAAAQAKAAPKPPPPPKDFELAIIEKPDDAAGYLVWGDALQSENDPLGTLIAASSAAKKTVFTAALKKHQKALFSAAVLKELQRGEVEFEWRHGVVHTVRFFGNDRRREDGADARLTALMNDVFSARAVRFVRNVELGVDHSWWRNDDDLLRLAWALGPIAKAAPPVLDSLTLGTADEPCKLGGVQQVFAACSRISKLVLNGDVLSWGGIQGPALTTLELNGDIAVDTITGLSAFPKLSTLSLKAIRSHAEPRPFAEALGKLPSLQHLTVRDYVQAEPFVVALAASPVLGKLKSLTLDLRNLGAKGVAALTKNAAALKKTRVSIENSKASRSALDELKKAMSV
jgi:hypothetical protein